ncbi:MAG: hypothetical protein AVDCRST_MAG33-2182 [uncultured Thermomicrobiales bacterium]|uniref:Uncharacterized protein n=1 Tax=uncultured Thermomicrobiales bacterium TaxID=1645740 RepID=A0A6J4V5B5_9BACT|nr:MAG: hypothetical protein AVDCRST_MAG33-2182 [uncultured Thermomicrobiales bacterium]
MPPLPVAGHRLVVIGRDRIPRAARTGAEPGHPTTGAGFPGNATGDQDPSVRPESGGTGRRCAILTGTARFPGR